MPSDSFATLAIALGVGMLVGLQRERSVAGAHIGGIRTFPLVTMLGALCAMAGGDEASWLVPAGFMGVVAAAVLGNVASIRRGDPEPGMTTEIAMMLMYVVGVVMAMGMREVAIAVGVGAAILLQLKARLHALVQRIGDDDLRAVLQFALITFVVLPVLPDETFGPFDVLNPRRIWLMVVLVVGISLCGYVLLRLVGGRQGTALAGILGGLISSTATTVSASRRVKDAEQGHGLMPATVAVLMLATAVMYARVVVLIFVATPEHGKTIAVPFAVVGCGVVLMAGASLLRLHDGSGVAGEHENPAELKGAMIFGAMYAAVLLAVAASKEWFGDSGLFAAAAISGLTDMDAITLSSSRMAERGRLDPTVVWRALMLASISNLVFKAGLAWVLGGRRLGLRVSAWFLGIALLSVGVMSFWPV